MRTRGVFGLALALLGATACAPNEEELKRDFARVIARSNACSADTDCVTFSPGCPLGCAVAINRQHEIEVRRSATDLVDDYERWGRGCAYECIGDLEPPRCADQRCEIPRPDPSQPDAGTPQD
jgi:hypothetical protein